MSRQSIIEYLLRLFGLYTNASKSEKTKLLDQAQCITGKSRRTVQRYLAKSPEELKKSYKIRGRGRHKTYTVEELLPHIRVLWKAMEMISAERMVAALPLWLTHYENEGFTTEVQHKLLLMSSSTLDRFLAILRGENVARRGLCTTRSGLRAFKAKIPINTLDQNVVRPGFTQADTVAHCGTSAAGSFLSTLTLTDLYSGWTENRALASKKGILVRRAFVDIKKNLPFELLALNTDSGSEFLNTPMIEFASAPAWGKPITFTRSRPYHKNDNCYVEQRNYTHVRQLFGYYRFEDPTLVELMNEIYTKYWGPMHNFFLPSQKLIEKTRVGAKIVKKHDTPKTAAERLLLSEHIDQKRKDEIRAQQTALNPFVLAKMLEERLAVFFDLHKRSSIVSHKEKEAA